MEEFRLQGNVGSQVLDLRDVAEEIKRSSEHVDAVVLVRNIRCVTVKFNGDVKCLEQKRAAEILEMAIPQIVPRYLFPFISQSRRVGRNFELR